MKQMFLGLHARNRSNISIGSRLLLIFAVLLTATGCSKSDVQEDDIADSTMVQTDSSVLTGNEMPSPEGGNGSLDGRTFIITTTEKGKDGSETDTVMFENGMFRSKGCDQYGFTPVAYTSTPQGDVLRYTAVATSPTEGQMSWTGEVNGDMIKGNALWEKEGQDAIDYSYDGVQMQ